ncbi:hypothetical protein BC826DRAFT_152120 [Russula brevipes]|nr:hypothetical protein BC826DRAFT_152120 [Russula brevipes]
MAVPFLTGEAPGRCPWAYHVLPCFATRTSVTKCCPFLSGALPARVLIALVAPRILIPVGNVETEKARAVVRTATASVTIHLRSGVLSSPRRHHKWSLTAVSHQRYQNLRDSRFIAVAVRLLTSASCVRLVCVARVFCNRVADESSNQEPK